MLYVDNFYISFLKKKYHDNIIHERSILDHVLNSTWNCLIDYIRIQLIYNVADISLHWYDLEN